MMRSETLVKVTEVIEQETGELVTPDTRLVTLVTDSLEMASLIQALEDGLGKEIPDCEAQNLFSVQDIVNYAEAH
jgi:acyl carrier protein